MSARRRSQLPQLSARGAAGANAHSPATDSSASEAAAGRRLSAVRTRAPAVEAAQFALAHEFFVDLGTSAGSDWQVQSPQEVLQDARDCVHRRRPGCGSLDEGTLEAGRPQDKSHRGCHIILPDNRVRAMEDQLSARVRARLLDTGPFEPPRAPRPQRRRPQAEGRPRAPPKPRTPWYLPPDKWFSKEASGETGEGGSVGFPYDGRYNARTAAAEQDGGAEGGPPSQREKESLQIVEAYRQYMKEENKRMVVKCQDKDEAAHMLTGEYEEQGVPQLDRRVYKKAVTVGRGEVFLSYWDGRDGTVEGWRFSSRAGGNQPTERPVQVYAVCPSDAAAPPGAGWRVPWDAPAARPAFQVKEKPQRKPAFLQ